MVPPVPLSWVFGLGPRSRVGLVWVPGLRYLRSAGVRGGPRLVLGSRVLGSRPRRPSSGSRLSVLGSQDLFPVPCWGFRGWSLFVVFLGPACSRVLLLSLWLVGSGSRFPGVSSSSYRSYVGLARCCWCSFPAGAGNAPVTRCFLFLFSTDMDSICDVCKKFKPNRTWDLHPSCPICRSCTKEKTCDICVGWEEGRWTAVDKFLTDRKRKLLSLAQDCTVSAVSGPLDSGLSESGRTLSSQQDSGPSPGPAEIPGRSAPKKSGRQPRKSGQSSHKRSGSKPADPPRDQPTSKGKQPLKGGSKSKSKSASSTRAQGQSTPSVSTAQEHVQEEISVPSPANQSPFGPDPEEDRDFEGFTPEDLLEIPATQSSGNLSFPDPDQLNSSGQSSRDRPRPVKRSLPQDVAPTEQLFNKLLQRLSDLLDSPRSQVPAQGVLGSSACQATTSSEIPAPQAGVQARSDHEPLSNAESSVEEVSDYSDDSPVREGTSGRDDALVPVHSDSRPSASRPDTSRRPSRSLPDQEDQEDSGDEETLLGTDITPEAFNNAVEVIRRVLGFDPPVADPAPPPAKASRLSLNKPTRPPSACIPVDAECSDRYDTLARGKRWTAFPKRPTNLFRVEESDWKQLFSSPSIPSAAKDKLVTAGIMDSKGRYVTKDRQSLESELLKLDSAARAGLKFSSALLLFAEVVMLAFQQREDRLVSRRDTGALLNLLGPTSRLVFDQLARISVRATAQRRDLVLDSLTWPSEAVKRRFKELPFSGVDLFSGRFEDLLQSEVKKHKDMRDADFRPKRKPRSPPKKSGTSRPFNRSSSSSGQRPFRRPQRQTQAFPRSSRGRRVDSRPPRSQPSRRPQWNSKQKSSAPSGYRPQRP